MSGRQVNWQKQNAKEWQKLDFVLKGRTTPVIIWITCNSYYRLREIYLEFKQRYPNQHHIEVTLDDFNDSSIPSFLKARLSKEKISDSGANILLHLFGIEKHLGIWESNEQKSKLFQALNFERELLFKTFNFHIIFWSEQYSQIKAQQLAPDFWDWLAYKFHFDAPLTNLSTKEFITIKSEDTPYTSESKDALHHRIARLLHELELLQANPNFNPREKVDLLKSIEDTWINLQEFKKAYECILKILEFESLLSQQERTHYFNELGLIYMFFGDYEKAFQYLEQSLKLAQDIGDRKGEGTTLNNISQIYDAKGDYDSALR